MLCGAFTLFLRKTTQASLHARPPLLHQSTIAQRVRLVPVTTRWVDSGHSMCWRSSALRPAGMFVPVLLRLRGGRMDLHAHFMDVVRRAAGRRRIRSKHVHTQMGLGSRRPSAVCNRHRLRRGTRAPSRAENPQRRPTGAFCQAQRLRTATRRTVRE